MMVANSCYGILDSHNLYEHLTIIQLKPNWDFG